MQPSKNRNLNSGTKQPGFFAVFPILWKIIWSYGRRLFRVETLAALERKQGLGSGERTVEDELLEQALQRNKHHYHLNDSALSRIPQTICSDDLTKPVLIVRKGGADEPHR